MKKYSIAVIVAVLIAVPFAAKAFSFKDLADIFSFRKAAPESLTGNALSAMGTVVAPQGASATIKNPVSPASPSPACNLATPPWIIITSPAAGAQLVKGQTYTVTWNSCNVPANALINMRLDGGEYNVSWSHGLSITALTNTGSTQVTVQDYTPVGFHKILMNANWNNNANFLQAVSPGVYSVVYPQSVCSASTPGSVRILVPFQNSAAQSLQYSAPQILWDDCNMPSRYKARVDIENLQTGAITNLANDVVGKEFATQTSFAQYGFPAGSYRFKLTLNKNLNAMNLPPYVIYSPTITVQ